MDNFNLDELMDLAEAYVGPMVDAIYRRLIERDFALEDPEVVMLLTALINILGHDNRGDRPTEVLLMAAYGERGVLDRPNMRVMRWRNGALSGSDLANEPGLGSSRTYQPGEMPMPSKPKPGLTRMHREMNSEATSSGSPLRAAVPPKRAKVTQKVQTNQTIQDLDEMNDQLRSTKKELDDMTKTMLAMEEDRDMWRKLFEDCNKKQGQEIEHLRQEYKERSEQAALTTAIEKVIPARDIPRGQSPMELLTPREMSQTTETRLPAETNRVTIPDPSDTLGDPVVEQTVRKLIETAGRLVANKNAPGSGVTAPYGTIDDTGRVQLSQTVIRKGMSNVTPLMGNSRIPERKVRKMPAKKVSRVIDVQKNNQLKYNFTGVPETDPRACFNRATSSPAVNLQQPPLGTSHLILGDSLVRVLSNLRTSWVTTVMAFGGATIAQLYRMVELMNPGKIPNVMILVGTNDISRGSDEQEALWESMMVCLFTTLWQKFSCAVLTVCTVPMNARSLTASGRRHNEGVMRWNNILRNLANRNAGRMILMDIEHELRAMDQARLTTDGIHFDSVEGQAWLNRVFQERLDELEAELFDTGVLKEEGTVSDTVITTFVPPNLETRLGTVPAVTNYRQQSSSEPGQRTDVQDRLGEAPMRRTIHPRRRIGPVNQPIEEVAGTSRSETRSETTSTSREERPETDPRACFNRATWSPAVNLQQPPLGTSHLILGDSLVRVLSNLRTSWVTTVMAFGGATIAQLYRMVELMNPGKIPNVMILVGTNDISRGSDEQEALWESMMVCLFTTLWQKFSCAVLTVCTVPMNARSLTASGRRHNEGVMRWNNILRNLANRNAGRMILMDIEHELRAMDQARLTTDGIHFDSVEGQAWLNRVFQERLDELEAELFDTGVLKEEGTVSDTVITTFVPPNLETRLGTVPAVTNYRQQSSSEPGQRTDVQDRLGEAPMRRTIHPRRRIGPVNQPIEEVAGTSRSETRSETTSTSREERPETDPRACFNRATWSPAVNLQQPPLGTSHLILGDSLVRVLSNLRTSWVTTVMAFGGATIAQLYRMVELMNPGKIPNVMILVGTNDISRGSDEQEALWESMMVCLFTTLWQKFSCAVLTVCTVPMNARSLTASGRRHIEGVMRWNNILRNLANRNAGRMILMDIEHELRAMDQARLTTDGIHFDSVEGQAWLNRVFQERLDELEAELFDTGVLKEEGTVSDTVITTFVPPNLETRLGTVPAVTNYRQQSSSEPGQRTDVQDRLGEAPMRRTIHPRRRIGPVNQPIEEVAGTSRSETRSETTSTSREERPSRGSLMWSRSIPSPWHIYKDELMKLDLQRVSFIEDARRMLNGATLSVSRLYSITGVDWLIAASINFSSTTALRFADLEGLPSSNTMGPVNARPLQDVRLNHDERNREERPGRFLTARAPIGQHVKIFRQLTTPPGNVKERVYPKLVNQDGDAQRYGGLTAIKKDETIFAAYDKAEMRKAKIMVVANSEFVYTSKSLFWPEVIMLAAVDLDLLQSVSLAIGVQRQTEMNPITIVFAGINDHLHSRGFLSRLRDPATAENAVWPAIKDILESMGEVVDATKEGSFNKVTLRVVFALSPGYAHLPDGLKFVYAMVALLSEGKYDVIISAPNRMIEMENLRPLKAELPAVWSDISNAMRGFKDHALHMLVLDEVLGLELSNFSRQLKLKPGIDDDHRVITAMSNDLWFRAMEVASEDTRRKNSLETRAHLEAMVLRTKPEANQWLHLNPRVAALGADAFQQGPVMITKIHAYLLKEVNLAENAGEKTAEFVNRMCQITLETFWT